MGEKVRDDTGKICPSVRIVNALSAGRGDLYQGMPRVLRALLNEAGQVAAQHNQELGLIYRRLLAGRGHATVKFAVARRLLVRVHHFNDVASQFGLPEAWSLQRGF